MDKHTHTYDVVIIGGGCSGSATALSLVQQGIENIAIVEKSDFSKLRVGETIQPPTSELLKKLGIWEQFLKEGHLASSGVASAWGTSELSHSDFIFRAQGEGWHLDRNLFDKMLLNIAEEKGATMFSQTRFNKASRDNNLWNIECEDFSLKAKFVVDASGRNCAFAKQQGSKKILFDDLHGVYTYWRQPKDSLKKFGTSHTLVESVENGWWYSALLPSNLLAVAFMTDTAEIKKSELKNTTAFLNQLKKSKHIHQRIINHKIQSSPSIKVATAYELDAIVGNHWLAVGDSASAYDPLSSYGIHKAIENALEAGKCIKAALKDDFSQLKEYENYIKQEFENFLEIRFKYYGMENRWSKSSFWESRQNIINVHPMQKLTIQTKATQYSNRWNRILSEEELNFLIANCKESITAHKLVKEFQERFKKKYPDWRVIQAVSFLYERKVIA